MAVLHDWSPALEEGGGGGGPKGTGLAVGGGWTAADKGCVSGGSGSFGRKEREKEERKSLCGFWALKFPTWFKLITHNKISLVKIYPFLPTQ